MMPGPVLRSVVWSDQACYSPHLASTCLTFFTVRRASADEPVVAAAPGVGVAPAGGVAPADGDAPCGAIMPATSTVWPTCSFMLKPAGAPIRRTVLFFIAGAAGAPAGVPLVPAVSIADDALASTNVSG